MVEDECKMLKIIWAQQIAQIKRTDIKIFMTLKHPF